MTCQCSDPACPTSHGCPICKTRTGKALQEHHEQPFGCGDDCAEEATVLLVRIDMADDAAQGYCYPCSVDAMECGLFAVVEG